MDSSIEKLYLISESTLRNLPTEQLRELVRENETKLAGGEGMTTAEEIKASPMTKGDERQVFSLKEMLDKVLADKTLDERDRLLEILRILKWMLFFRGRVEGEKTMVEPLMKTTAPPKPDPNLPWPAKSYGFPTTQELPPTTTTQSVMLDPESLYRTKSKMFAQSVMSKSIQAKIRPKFKLIMEQLK